MELKLHSPDSVFSRSCVWMSGAEFRVNLLFTILEIVPHFT